MVNRGSLSLLIATLLLGALAGCEAPVAPETGAHTPSSKAKHTSAASTEEPEEEAETTSALSPQQPSCTAAESTVTKPCATGYTGSILVKTSHVCDASGVGKDVVTETSQCAYPCAERAWTEDLACGPRDVQERVIRYMKHVCDGSNQGAGQDIKVSDDISGCQGHSPLVLDLDGDGITVLDVPQSTAHFDLLNDGHAVHTAWVGPREAFLTLDRNHDGIVNDRSELFGDMRGATNGFEDLAKLDDNGDGVIDARDGVFAALRLWVDANGDGVSQRSELFTLADRGVTSIRLRAESLGAGALLNGQHISDRSTFTTKDGQERSIVDIWFKTGR